MSKDRAFEVAGEKANRTNHPHWVYQMADGKWRVSAREHYIPRGVINYGHPCFRVEVTARIVLSTGEE